MTDTLKEFLETYAPEGQRQVIELDLTGVEDGHTPFIVVRHGKFAVVLNPIPLRDHLSVDAHPFVDGKDATVGVLGFNTGRRVAFPDAETTTTSHHWASVQMAALLVGEQGERT